MKKIYTISFAIVCAVTVFAVNGQYDVLPKTITPANNMPQYSIFDEEGKPLFDTLYIPAKQWTEYVKFWHTNVDNYTQTSAQQIKGEFSPIDYVGKRQQKDGTFVSDPEGFILENPRDVTTTAYYGVYTLTVRYKFHIEQKRTVNVQQYWKVNYNSPTKVTSGKPEGSKDNPFWALGARCSSVLYCWNYKVGSVTAAELKYTYESEPTTEYVLDGVEVFFSELPNLNIDAPKTISKLADTDKKDEVQSVALQELGSKPWTRDYTIPTMTGVDKKRSDCAHDEYTTREFVYRFYGGYQPTDEPEGKGTEKYTELNNGTESRSISGEWDDMIYVWPYFAEDENDIWTQDKNLNNWKLNDVLLSYNTNVPDLATLKLQILNEDGTVHFPNGNNPDTKKVSETNVVVMYDTIAQIRHHLYLVTPYSANTNYQTPLNYYDYTWYDISRSPNGNRKTSTMIDAPYHEWDEQYEETGSIKQILDNDNAISYLTQEESQVRGKNCFAVYGIDVAANNYKYGHLLPYTTMRGGDNGVLYNKSLYISGTADGLAYLYGDGCGWIELVNAHVYLEDAKLCTANNAVTGAIGTFSDSKKASELKSYKVDIKVQGSGAVFYLPDDNGRANTSYIHLKGNNYIGTPNRTGVYEFALEGTVNKFTLPVSFNRPRLSSPIEIRDALVYGDMPIISCIINDDWNNETTGGYLDIAVKPWVSGFQARNNPYYNGYRYATPLYTGGNHGTFIITGGKINLWSANGYAFDCNISKGQGDDAAIIIESGTFSNYLVCGAASWKFGYTNDSLRSNNTNTNLVKNQNMNISANLYGVGGGGLSEGNLIFQGGTITANTDTKSFGYNKNYLGSKYNVGDSNYGGEDAKIGMITAQPLLGPSITNVTGGTFEAELYGCETEMKKGAKTWENAIGEEYAEPKNEDDEELARVKYTMPQPTADYSFWNEQNLKDAPMPNANAAIVADQGQANEYFYGMQTVWSDANAKCYFYLPVDNNWRVYKNYHVPAGETLADFDKTTYPYNVMVDEGGYFYKDENFTVYGRPYYRQKFIDNTYYAVAMPFEVDEVSDKYGAMNGFVEPADNPDANNSNAYFYMYHLIDENGEQRTTGINDDFRKNYHTHPTGDYMEKDKVYLIKFPSNKPYWMNNYVTFRGAEQQNVNGAAAYRLITRPQNDNEFVMAGNATFAPQSTLLSGEYYVINPNYNEQGVSDKRDDFHAATLTELKPLQGYVLGTEETMKRFRVVAARDGVTTSKTPDVTTDITEQPIFSWLAYADKGILHIGSEQSADFQILSPSGVLCTSVHVDGGYVSDTPLPQGVYIVKNGNENRKVIVY